MKAWLKGGIWGAIIGILLALLGSRILSWFICPDFFRIGPNYPTDQLFCSFLISNHYSLSITLLIWIFFMSRFLTKTPYFSVELES